MSINSALQSAASGLRLNSLKADVAATNIANASIAGYVRRSVISSELLVGGQSAGVQAEGIARQANDVLTGDRRALGGDKAQADILASTWQTLSQRVGDTLEGDGLFQDFQAFETALSNAATTPESATALTISVEAARTITGSLNSLADLGNTLRTNADRSIASGVDRVNAALEEIEVLNSRVARATDNSATEATLRDERGRLLDEISQFLPIETAEREGGRIDVMTKEGVFLLAGEAKTLSFQGSPIVPADASLENGELSGLSVDGAEITPGTASYAAIGSGELAALFAVRDQDVAEVMQQIDIVAADLMARFAGEVTDPDAPAGSAGLFIDSGNESSVGLAGRIAVNPAVDPEAGGAVWRLRDGFSASAPGPVGDGARLKAMLEGLITPRAVAGSDAAGVLSAVDLVADISSSIGQTRVQQDATLASVTAQHDAFSNAEIAETGVDIDVELQELLLIEQAYAANARVIEVADRMINRLMDI